MFDPSLIFHRTPAGRAEIKQKSYGLTQSERLVLIMIDGVSTYSQVRSKLPALSDERFMRALTKLQQKELVLEVFMPVEGQEAEELEPAVIDRFLQQDPLDPVTIMMVDPDELEGRSGTPVVPVMPAVASAPVPAAVAAALAPAAPLSTLSQPPVHAAEDPVTISVPPTEEAAQPAMDDLHNELADLLAEEVRQSQSSRPPRMERLEPAQIAAAAVAAAPVVPVAPRRLPGLARLHWGYWMIGLGCAFIGTFVIARIGT